MVRQYDGAVIVRVVNSPKAVNDQVAIFGKVFECGPNAFRFCARQASHHAL